MSWLSPRLHLLLLSGTFWICSTDLGLAQTMQPARPTLPESSPVSPAGTPGYGGILLSIAVMLVLLGVAAFLIRRGAFSFGAMHRGERKLNICETRMLGSRQFIVVVEYENSRMLLGVTPGKIDYLCPLEPSSSGKAFSDLLPKEGEGSAG